MLLACDNFLHMVQGGPCGTARAADAAHRLRSASLLAAAAPAPVGLARKCENPGAAIGIQQSPGFTSSGRACPAARLFRVGPEPVKSAYGVGLRPIFDS